MKKNKMSLLMILKIAFTYIGAIIGAGFASGQEIFHFFIQYGREGLIGLILAGLLFIIGGVFILQLAQRFKVDYYKLFYRLLGKGSGFMVDLIYIIFILGSISVMLAGSGVIFHEALGVRYSLGVLITLFIVLVIVYSGVRGIFMLNTFLIPFLILVIIYTSYIHLNVGPVEINSCVANVSILPWYISGIVYVSFNLFLSMAIMIDIGSKVRNPGVLFSGGIVGGGLIMLILLLMGFAMYYSLNDIGYVEMPMLLLADQTGPVLYLIYMIGLWFAIITTAVANVYGFIHRVMPLFKLNYYNSAMLTIVVVLPLTRLGFANLVKYLYPVYGVVALGVLGVMALKVGVKIK
ncbi:hypothetical protein BBF96_13260 [Anoxybacter fermentans]|uniref:Transporter n=1 Tax=Anoxybacter fermentans TaxID=1323375 RepID=A0A3S9T148_9FIRM|nr:hypothetical protein [Anoxybacter fermentans]AZR74284.1 hypothetical protein BBF96_13260 [Anoxybacter fermentans]